MAQQRLRDSEERYALALEGTSDGIWDWNPITGELYLSRRWKELLGFAESELPNNESAFFSRIHPDDAQAVGLAVREHLGHGVPYDVECRLLHRDGSYRWVRSRAKALRNEAGEVYRMVGTISDITERKILELDAQRWKQVFEQAEFGLAYGDVRTNTILSVNQAFARQLGYRIDELVGQPILNIYAPEARALIKGRLEAADRGGHLSYESIYQRKDGTIFPVWIEVTVIRDERGQPISRVAYAKDITEGKRAERALIDREAELRMALEAAEEGTFDYNVREDRTIFSEKALAMFGFGPQDRATYDDCISRVHHDDRPRVSEWFAQCMREKTEYQAEYRVELPNGEVKWIFAKGRGVYDQAGELERALGVLLDITERKLAERALLASEERYRHLFMASPHPMWVYDLETLAFLAVNDAAVAHYGYSRDEFLQRTIKDIQPAEDVESGVERTGISRHLKKNGTPIDVEITSHRLQFDGRRADLVLAFDVTERIVAEAELHESQERFRQLAENIKEVFWLTTVDKDRVIYVSPSYEEIWRRKCESLEVDPRSWLYTVHPDDRSRVLEAALTKQVTGEYREEYRIVRPDGSVRWIFDRAFPVRDKTGRIYRIAGIAEDVTERKGFEEALRESEQKLSLFVEHAPAAIAMFDREMRYLAASNRWCNGFGVSKEGLLGRSHYDLLPDLPERWKEAHRRGLAGAIEGCDADEWKRADGRIEWIRWEVRPWPATGTVKGLIIFSEVITDRIQAEQALQQSEARFRNVVEMAPAGMIVLDSEERIILVNAALEKIFGYSREELLGKTVDLLLPDDVRRNHGEAVRSFFRNPAARTMGAGRDLRGRCKDGRMVFVEIGLSPIDTIQGMAVLASVVDITERKRIERLGEGQRAILESIEKGSALSDTLTMLCRVIEGQADGLFCTILLRDGDRLRFAAGPSLPSEYHASIGDIRIGPTAGSCGTAAFTGETVVTDDISTEPRWDGYRDLALQYGLRACWSTPICGRDGAVLGTFAVYSREPHRPSERELKLVQTGGHLGGIAIERYRTERSLRDSEERFRLVAEATNDILWDWDLTTNDHWWSPNACERFAYDPQNEPSVEAWISRLHPDDKERILTLAESAVQSDLRSFSAEYRFRLADGTYGHFLDRAHIVRNEAGVAVRLIGAMIDVTGSKRAYASLEAAYQRLQAMSQELQTVESNERRRLSRELHDEVGQLLASLKFDLTSVKRSLAGRLKSAGGASYERLARALETTDLLFTRLRQIVRALRPPVLEELGLKAGLEALIADVQARTGLRCSLEFERRERRAARSPTVETAIYRVVQELLTNVIRHAQATQVAVVVHESRREWRLTVKDDGIGFDVAALSPTGGFGLRGIRERVEILAGQVDILSAPGAGTTVQVRIPAPLPSRPSEKRVTGATTPRRRRRSQAHD